jgi:hypothetical protein
MNLKATDAAQMGVPFMLCIVLIAAKVDGAPWYAPADSSSRDGGIEVANLTDQLTFGLRARLPREHAFIKLVVEKVETGDLPLELVMSTFHWARQKRPYPFPYFEFALRLRAAKYGVLL